MTHPKSIVAIAIATFVLMAGFVLSYSSIAKAAVSVFSPATCYTAAATSTLSYMTAGTATTTTPNCFLGLEGAGSASVLIQFTASSTSSVLVANVEYSQDGVDWYQNSQDVFAAGAVAIATPSNSFTWTYASTTVNGAAVGAATNIGTKIVKINVPSKYVRVVFSLTGTNGAVWAQILPRQPIN